jgi:hypothetical protein
VQTVPDCPVLFKNTFTYHTITVAPPDYDECFRFLGMLPLARQLV